MVGNAANGSIRADDIEIVKDFVVDVNAHASGDLLAQPIQLVDASHGDSVGSDMTTLHHVAVIDYDDQGKNLSLMFHNVDPVDCGTLNAAPVLSATKADSFVGSFAVTTWEDIGAQQTASHGNIGLTLKTDEKGDLWVWLLSKGAGTYAGGKIRVKFNFLRS